MGVILNPQYVVDNEHSTKAVMLSIEEWNQVLEELEELEDIRSYDAAKAGPQETVLLRRIGVRPQWSTVYWTPNT